MNSDSPKDILNILIQTIVYVLSATYIPEAGRFLRLPEVMMISVSFHAGHLSRLHFPRRPPLPSQHQEPFYGHLFP